MKKEYDVAVLVFFILFLFFIKAFADGGIYWQENGVLLCDSTFGGSRYPLTIVSDSCGGAIVVWQDNRTSLESLYAQRVDSSGNIRWDTNGVFVGTSGFIYISLMPKAVSDGECGMIVTWTDTEDIFVQRIDSTGTGLWGANGVKIRDAPGGDTTAGSPRIVSDGQGGAIISMIEGTYGAIRVFAQRVDANGNPCWQSGGVPICDMFTVRSPASMMGDVGNRVIVFWEDTRNGSNYDVYAQRIMMDGTVSWQQNGIRVCSLSTDQRIGFSSWIKGSGSNIVIPWFDYRNGKWDIYAQRLDTNGIYQWPDSGVAVRVEVGRAFWQFFGVRSDKGIILEWLDDRSGGYHDLYAQKLNLDGTTAWPDNGLFIARVADTSQESHDLGITIESDKRDGAIFVWEDYRFGNADIFCQRVDSSGVLQWFVTGLPICSTPENQKWGPVLTINGKGGAIVAWADIRLGGSVWAQRIGDGGTPVQEFPQEIIESNLTVLSNPSRYPSIEYTIDRNCWVSLRIYDVTGRLVKTLINEKRDAGVYNERWNGRNNNNRRVAAGVYFTRLASRDFISVKKVILVR